MALLVFYALAALTVLSAMVTAFSRNIVYSAFALFGSLAALLEIYSTLSIAAAIQVARHSGWRFFPLLPVVFTTYHVSYGLGFLLGIVYRPADWNRPSTMRNALTAITR